jgi:hypothetical protein
MLVHPADVLGDRGVASGDGAADALGSDDGSGEGDGTAAALGEAAATDWTAVSLADGAALGVGVELPQAARIAATTVIMTMCRFDGCTQTLRSGGPYAAPDAVPMG